MGRRNRRAKQDSQKLLIGFVDSLLKVCSSLVPTGSKLYEEHLQIHKLVEQIRSLEQQDTEDSLNLPNREEFFDVFLEWLRSKGVSTDGLSIAQFGDGNWGLKAERPIKEGQLWITVPHEIMMTTVTAQKSHLGDVIQTDPILRHLPQVALSLHLLEERLNPDSFWKPYLDILPSTYDTVLYFSPKDFELLKGSPCFEDSLKHYRHIARQYAYFWRLLRRPNSVRKEVRLTSGFSYDAYRWATSTVMTRQNAVPAQDATHQPLCALIPFWDMCNHCPGKLTTDFNLQNGTLECYALRDLDKGDQGFIFYGPRPNSEFFLHNAFVDPDNKHDKISIKLGISKNDVLGGKKDSLLQKLNIQRMDTFYVTSELLPISSRLRAFSRVFAMTEAELDTWLSLEADIQKGLCASIMNDDESDLNNRAEKFLLVRLQLILRAYPTTIEEDKTMLHNSDLTNRERLAINLRLTEKEILFRTVEMLNLCVKLPAENEAS